MLTSTVLPTGPLLQTSIPPCTVGVVELVWWQWWTGEAEQTHSGVGISGGCPWHMAAMQPESLGQQWKWWLPAKPVSFC